MNVVIDGPHAGPRVVSSGSLGSDLRMWERSSWAAPCWHSSID
ncbi:hypothetical protein OH799_08680 [Nocardia sp. NBC_00881]|nr:hypothetical protein OH799_08680 [Nocardia sp. NBC_00881]